MIALQLLAGLILTAIATPIIRFAASLVDVVMPWPLAAIIAAVLVFGGYLIIVNADGGWDW